MDWETILSEVQSHEPNEDRVEYYNSFLNLKNDNASLITEIDRLTSELDATQHEKGRGLSKINLLKQNLKGYKRKCKELMDVLDILERACGRYHKDAHCFREKFENSLAEMQGLKMDRNKLSEEVERLTEISKRVENERNSALESAEQIQESLIDMNNQFNKRFLEMESQIREIMSEKESMSMACEQNHSELVRLHEKLKNANSEIQQQVSVIKRLEIQKKDFLNRSHLKTQEIKRLECEMSKFEEMKKEHKRINAYSSELRKRAERYEHELKEMKHDFDQFEVLVTQLCQHKFLKKANIKIGMSGLTTQPLKKLVDYLIEVDKERKWNHELITSLEAKISELQFNKTSLEFQLSQVPSRELKINGQLKDELEETALENELRLKSKHVERLECQLKEIESLLKNSQSKCLHIENQFMVESQRRNVLESEVTDLRLQVSARNKLLEDLNNREKLLQEAMGVAKAKLGTSEENFARAEKRCDSLQKSLDEIVEATHCLKIEIQQSEEKRQEYISSLEKELQNKSEKCDEFKKEIVKLENSLMSENATQIDEIKKQHTMELDDSKKLIKSLMEELDNISNSKMQTDQELEHIRKIYDENEEVVKANAKYVEHLEKNIEKLHKELDSKDENVCKIAEASNCEIGHLMEQLKIATDNLKNKEEIILVLTREQTQAMDQEKEIFCAFGKEMEKTSAELRDERKKNNKLLLELDSTTNEKDKLTSAINDVMLSHEKLKRDHSMLISEFDMEMNKSKSLVNKIEKLSAKLALKILNNKREVENHQKEMERIKREINNHRKSEGESVQEVSHYRLKISDLEEELKKMLKEFREKVSIIQQLEEDAKAKENKLKETEKELNGKKSEIHAKDNLIETLQEQAKQLSDSLKSSLDSRQALDEKCELRKFELKSYIVKMDSLERAMTCVKQEKQHAMDNLSKMASQLELYKNKFNSLQRYSLDTKNELFTKREEHLQLMTEMQEKSNLLISKEEKIEELIKLVEVLKHENEEEKRHFQISEGKLRFQLDKIKTELIEIKEEKATREEEINHLKKKIRDSGIQHHRLTQELKQLASDLAGTRSELEAQKAIMDAKRESLLVKELMVKNIDNKLMKDDNRLKDNVAGSQPPNGTSTILNFEFSSPDHHKSLLPSKDSNDCLLSKTFLKCFEVPQFFYPNQDTPAFHDFKGLPNFGTTTSLKLSESSQSSKNQPI